MINLIKELWVFGRDNKKWWVIPIVVIFLLLVSLIIFTESPRFVYGT